MLDLKQWFRLLFIVGRSFVLCFWMIRCHRGRRDDCREFETVVFVRYWDCKSLTYVGGCVNVLDFGAS